MFSILHALGMFAIDLFKRASGLKPRIRHQLNIAMRRAPDPETLQSRTNLLAENRISINRLIMGAQLQALGHTARLMALVTRSHG